MKRLTGILAGLALVCGIVLAGCSSENKVSNGVNKMLDITKQLSQAIDDGDQAKVKKLGPTLEQEWSGFEDQVKKENQPLYEKIESYLDPTIAGTKASNLDREALSKLNNQLTDALEKLAAKTK